MALNIAVSQAAIDEEKLSDVHLIPCKIHHNGPANVSGFFTPYIGSKNTEGSEKVYEASFRGYSLQGEKIDIPIKYTGLILSETKRTLTECETKSLHVAHKFDKFSYWNWDYHTNRGDPIQQAMDWLEISDVIHNDDD